ncbi:MAG: Permease of the major facilitator superfamily [Myxococcaceae bacterium]|nr:Permease of the major facilitator superfamily [Myxococcaceae bacterium]
MIDSDRRMSTTLSAVQAPVSAFHFRDFRLFVFGRLLATLAMQMQGVAVGWQVYAITGRALDLGYVGLVQFLPALLMSLLTGHVADRFNRRYVLIVCYSVMVVCTTLLFVSSRSAQPSVVGIYAVLALVGTARAFLGPASSAFMPSLVPSENFPSAVAWSSSMFQVAVIAGPALGGLLYSMGSASQVYALAIGLELACVLTMSVVRARSVQPSNKARSFGDLLAGLRYVWEKPVILGAISLDLFAVLFGGAVALLPIYARDILHIGPQGMGLLRSAPAIGALIVGVLLAQRPIRRHAGRAMYLCVALFGIATIVFGLSRNFVVSLLALILTGAADMVSVFVRQSLVQLRTPDAMRGRVAAVNLVFVGASNEFGEFESGLTAAWLGVVPAVVAGGVGTLLVVGLWAVLFPALREIDRLDGKPQS